jgi:hypothetical protein
VRKWLKWVLGAFVVLVIIGAVAGGGDDEPSSSGNADKATTSETREDASGSGKAEDGDGKAKDDAGCGTSATSDCTPRVGPDGQVRVDALYYRLVGVRTAETLGDQEYGLGERADGVFVIAKIRVRSDKDESATLTDRVFQLEVDGNTYDPDSEGTIAAVGAREEPFFLKDIGPDATTTGTVVYDVPRSVLRKKPALRFNELGFGDGHGYITLPSLD